MDQTTKIWILGGGVFLVVGGVLTLIIICVCCKRKRKGDSYNYSPIDGSLLTVPYSDPPDTESMPVTHIIEESAPGTQGIEESVPVTQEIEESTPVTQEIEESTPVTQEIEESTPVTQEIEESVPVTQDVEESVPVTQDVEESIPINRSYHEDSISQHDTSEDNHQEIFTSLTKLRQLNAIDRDHMCALRTNAKEAHSAAKHAHTTAVNCSVPYEYPTLMQAASEASALAEERDLECENFEMNLIDRLVSSVSRNISVLDSVRQQHSEAMEIRNAAMEISKLTKSPEFKQMQGWMTRHLEYQTLE